jgi:hypothetical protein
VVNSQRLPFRHGLTLVTTATDFPHLPVYVRSSGAPRLLTASTASSSSPGDGVTLDSAPGRGTWIQIIASDMGFTPAWASTSVDLPARVPKVGEDRIRRSISERAVGVRLHVHRTSWVLVMCGCVRSQSFGSLPVSRGCRFRR